MCFVADYEQLCEACTIAIEIEMEKAMSLQSDPNYNATQEFLL